MLKIKKLKFPKSKKLLVLVIMITLLIPITPTLGRFIYKEIKNYYFNTKKFYFESDKLDEDLAYLQIDNWNGVDTYNITINLNSYKNSLVKSDNDIDYNITYECSTNLNCSSSKTSGTIRATDNTDSFIITMTPNMKLNDGDSVWMEVKATSSNPYEKTLKGRFILNVGFYGLSYEITDNPDDLYLEVKVTNTLDYYNIITAFDSYKVGDKIDINTYLGLPDDKKRNCASSIVNLEFDPSVILLDMTSTAYLNALSSTTTTINEYEYINNMSFKVDAISSEIIRFYKVTPANDYSYPNENNTSIVNVTFN